MDRRKKKALVFIGILIPILGFIYLIISFGMHFSGHNTYAEDYEIEYPETKVIETINSFKASHSDYQVPRVTIENSNFYDFMPDGRDTGFTRHWYTIYFYLKGQNAILFTETSQAANNKTNFRLVSINKGLEIGHWKDVNKDLTDEENEQVKQIFENQILNPIRQQLNSAK